MQVGSFIGREQRPGAVRFDALHEEIRHPVGRVHVVGTTAIVTSVLAQVEELLDVDVPGLEIAADGALALAALVDGDGGVVGDLQERHDALRLAVGALDVRAEAAHRRPVIAETARVLREQGIVLDGFEYAVEIVCDGGEEAGGELRAAGFRR